MKPLREDILGFVEGPRLPAMSTDPLIQFVKQRLGKIEQDEETRDEIIVLVGVYLEENSEANDNFFSGLGEYLKWRASKFNLGEDFLIMAMSVPALRQRHMDGLMAMWSKYILTKKLV